MLKNEEEFNNFMHRVTEINSIVKNLSSTNKEQQKRGLHDADEYLNDKSERMIENIDDQKLELKVTTHKTIINKVKETKPVNENEMDPDTFMKEIEKDANQRSAERKVRKEKAETLKVQGNKAFKRKEYEKALVCYSKALDYVRDSCILYLNRALCYIELKFYDKAEKDCYWALKLNENSLKGLTYMAKIYFEKNDINKCNEYLKEAMEKHPDQKEAIQVFVTDLDAKSYENK